MVGIRRCTVVAIAVVWGAATLGCTEPDDITAYTVPKPHVVRQQNHGDADSPPRGRVESPPDRETPDAAPREPTDRLLATLVPHGDWAWFFKLVGSKDAVGMQSEVFAMFIGSLRFSNAPDSQVEWKLPAGWTRLPDVVGRYATLRIGDATSSDGTPLVLAVTRFPRGEGNQMGDALANVNRWRGQMGLPAIGPRELAKNIKHVELEGATATIVDILGNQTSGGMRRPPFAR